MANWALVIGVDQYWAPEACLRGAVRDALRMRTWLLSSEGGDVPAENLFLLLSPTPDSPQININRSSGEVRSATRDDIVLALDDLLQASGGQGERFFFYFAGHGATARIDFSNEDSIVPTDFTPRLTAKAIPLRSIFEYVQASRFEEQFFFIDACRNIPWEKEEREFRVGPLDVPRRPEPPVPPQFIMYATAPLLRAAELREPGDERGVFTQALLAGLEGEGQAKVWDDRTQGYVLHWDRLFQYVDAQVCELMAGQRSVDDTAGGAGSREVEHRDTGARDARGRQQPATWPQRPRQAGERGGENPALGCFAADAFPGETLEVDLDPGEAAPEAEIVVGDLGGEVERRSNIDELPVRFLLPPKTYSVRARARAYRPEVPYYPIDLYGPQSLEVRLLLSSDEMLGLEEALPGLGPVSRPRRYLPEDLREEALSAARGMADERERAKALLTLCRRLPERLRRGVLGEALEAVRGINDEQAQAEALVELGPHLSQDLLAEALAAAQAIGAEPWRAEALAGLQSPPLLPKGRGQETEPGILSLTAADPLAQIELADSAGRRLTVGEGSLLLPNQAPGFYRARLVTPEGGHTEKLLELLPGEQEAVQLEAPVPSDSLLFRQLAERGRLDLGRDNMLRPASAAAANRFMIAMPAVPPREAIGAMATARLSTLLALAGGAANEPEAPEALRLSRVGVRSLRQLAGGGAGSEASSGVQILLGVDAAGADEAESYLAQTRLRCWAPGEVPSREAAVPLAVPDLPGLAQFAWTREPGACWLAIETPEQRPVAFVATVLPGRLTLVVFTRGLGGEIALHQYLPLLATDEGDDARTARDGRTGARYSMLQRSELIQRAYAAGYLEVGSANVLDLLRGKWFEPLAACLAGYALLGADPLEEVLRQGVDILTESFAGLPDSHVLHAAYLEAVGDGDAAAAYRAALDQGLPMLDESLVRLWTGVVRHEIEHGSMGLVQRVYERRVRGLLWAAVSVEDLGDAIDIDGIIVPKNE